MFVFAFQLLNSLARDLDHMLNDLSLDQDSAPPPTEPYPVTRSATCPVTRSVALGYLTSGHGISGTQSLTL